MRLSLVVLLSVVACRPPAQVPPPPNALPAGRPRVAVLALHPAETLDPAALPPDLGLDLARTLAAKLQTDGVSVVDPDRVFGATGLVDTGVYGPPLAARVARKVGANIAVVGVLTRYRERVGTDWSVERPASVAYEALLVRANDGATLDRDAFDYTQQSLTSNLLDLPRFLRGGGRWLTGRELLDGALGETATRFARSLGVATPAAPAR